MSGERPAYRSYLLRLWRAHSGERFVWRASLEDPHTGERRGFAGLEQMLAFLENHPATGAAASEDLPRAGAETGCSDRDR